MNRNLYTLFAWMFILFAVQLPAQTLTKEQHVPLPSDTIIAYKLPYISVTDSGRNCLWNFSDILTDNVEPMDINFFAPSSKDTSAIGLHREHANYYYRVSQDTMWLTDYETSRVYMHYTNRIPMLRFPFEYGDSLVGIIDGKGRYCHMTSWIIEGSVSTHADATGCLILPEDTFPDALRVHTTIQYREKVHPQHKVQEERQQWYSPYCRYPLFETVHVQTIKNIDTVTFTSSYYFPQEIEPQPMQERIMPDTVMNVIDSLITDVSYLPNPVYTNLKVNYTLVRSAQVYISLHYNGGISTYRTPIHNESEGEHSVSVNMTGMPIGSYVVYIHADDTIVSGSIIKL